MADPDKRSGRMYDVDRLVAHLNGIQYDNHMQFQLSPKGKEQIVIPITIRENPRAEGGIEVDSAASALISEDKIRRDSFTKIQRIIAELADKGLVKNADSIELRTVAGGKQESHMSWATMNAAGADSIGPILGGDHVEAKLVIPVSDINESKVADTFVTQRAQRHTRQVSEQVQKWKGIESDTILQGIMHARGAEDMAHAMMNLMGNYELRQTFIEQWNAHAQAKKSGGVSKPLYIMSEPDTPEHGVDDWRQAFLNQQKKQRD